MKKLREEIQKLKEAESETIKRLEEEKQTLEKSAKTSKQQVEALNAEKGRSLRKTYSHFKFGNIHFNQ